jgi:hypothetical protein
MMRDHDWTTVAHPPDNTQREKQDKPKKKTAKRARLTPAEHEEWLERERHKQETLIARKETLLAKAEADKQAAAARQAKREEEKALKLRKLELEQFVVDALNRSADPFMFTPEIYPKLWADDKGEKHCMLINEPDNTCKDSVMSVVKDEITRFVYQVSALEVDGMKVWDEYGTWTDRQIESCYRRWKHFTYPEPKPKAWAFKSDPSLTYYRHNFDPDPTLPTPYCDEFLSRIHDRDTFMAWVGSLFVPKSYRQQYFYLQGAGGESKGTISRLLYNIFKDDSFFIQQPTTDKFFGSMYAGKRLVCLDDLRDMKFMRSGVFMSLTGGGRLQLERKRIDVVNDGFNGKIFILSNYYPNILADNHDYRRILWSWIDPLPQGTKLIADDHMDALIYSEAAGFIGKCLEAYWRRCPNHEMLVQPDHIKDRIKEFAGDDEEDDFYAFASETFTFDDKSSFVCSATVKNLITNQWPRKKPKSLLMAFKQWVIKEKGVTVKTINIKGDRRKAYVGMGLSKKTGGWKNTNGEWVNR